MPKTYKSIFMDKNEKKFEEQDHPLKNTDNAFVKVGKDGSPEFPTDEKKDDDGQNDTTTIDHH